MDEAIAVEVLDEGLGDKEIAIEALGLGSRV